jgi:hypothetical protein
LRCQEHTDRRRPGQVPESQEHATNLRSIMDDVRAQGTTSVRKIAEELNNRGILAPRGEWQATTVVRLLARLRVQAG